MADFKPNLVPTADDKYLAIVVKDVSDDDNFVPNLVPTADGKYLAQPVILSDVAGEYATVEQLNSEVTRATQAEGQLQLGITANAQEIEACNLALNTYQDTMGAGTGFVDRNECTLTFEENPYKLVIKAKDMENGFQVAFHGRIYTKFQDEITIDWTGNRYIIYDDNAQGLVSVQYPDSLDHIIVSYVYFNPNSEVPYVLAADERHQSMRNPVSHYLHHREFGATWLNGGAVHYHVDGEDDPEIELDGIGLSDEGLEFTIRHSDDPYSEPVDEGILEQNMHPLRAPVLYQDENSVWSTDEVSELSAIKLSANNIPTYNDMGGQNVQVELQNGQFVSYWICSTNSKIYPIKLVQGNTAHDEQDDCLDDEFKSLGLPMPEIIAMWQIIYEYSTDYISEQNPYGIRIAKIVSPKRAVVGGEQYFGNDVHSSLSGREQPNQHPTEAIHDISRNKALPAVLTDIEAEIARVVLLTENGRNRGQVDNAFVSQGTLLSIDTITITNGGSGYALNDLIYIINATAHKTAILRVSSVVDGVIVSVTLVTAGAYENLDDYTITTTGLGTGLTFTFTTTQNAMTTLNDIENVNMGDYVYVSHDETHNSDTWLYYWADEDGDGQYGWVPIVRVNEVVRDFIAQPIVLDETSQYLQDRITGSLQRDQLQPAAPTSASTDEHITTAKALYTLLGGALTALTTTAKTIIGAINEIEERLTNFTYEKLKSSDMKGKYVSGSGLATNAQISVTLTDIQFGLTKSSTSNQFSIWFANISGSSKVYSYHLCQQYGTAEGRYQGNPTLANGAYTVMRDTMNYGGDCNFIGTITDLTADKMYEIIGEGQGNNIRIYARLLNG
jgi:hypothetical protein